MDDILLNIDEYFLKAQEQCDEWNFVAGKRLLEDIIKEAPDYGIAHNLLGWIYQHQLHNPEVAEQYYKVAISLTPSFAPSFYNYCTLLHEAGHHEESLKYAQEGVALKSKYTANFYLVSGNSYELMKLFEKADAAYQNAIFETESDDLIGQAEQGIERVNKKKRILESRKEKEVVVNTSGYDIQVVQ